MCRAERLEIFDEFEEWNMIQVGPLAAPTPRRSHSTFWPAHNCAFHAMQDHYCVVTAVSDVLGLLQNVGIEQLTKPVPLFPATNSIRAT